MTAYALEQAIKNLVKVLQITKKINGESPEFLEKTFKVIDAAKKS